MLHSWSHSTPLAPGQSKFRTQVWDLGSPLRVPRRLHAGLICPVDQLPIDLGADRRFNDGVVNIAQNARLCAEFNPICRVDVAFDDAVQDDIGREDRAFHAAVLAHRQEGALVRVALDVAVDIAVQMQAAGEFDIAVDSSLGADQGVDTRVLTLFLFEHLRHPCPEDCRLPRFPPTFLAPSKRTPDENCGSSLCLCRCESRPRRASARTPAAIVWVRRNPESSGRSMPG